MHDPRIGRFFAVDPLTRDYPYYTPYSFSGNRVMDAIELEGLETVILTGNTPLDKESLGMPGLVIEGNVIDLSNPSNIELKKQLERQYCITLTANIEIEIEVNSSQVFERDYSTGVEDDEVYVTDITTTQTTVRVMAIDSETRNRKVLRSAYEETVVDKSGFKIFAEKDIQGDPGPSEPPGGPNSDTDSDDDEFSGTDEYGTGEVDTVDTGDGMIRKDTIYINPKTGTKRPATVEWIVVKGNDTTVVRVTPTPQPRTISN